MITILLVDKNRSFREALRSLLDAEPDLEVIGEASNGESALAMAEELKPEVVLIEVLLPGLGGLETTRQLLSDQPAIRVILLSLYSESSMVDAISSVGACAHVRKDEVFSDLPSTIRCVLV